MKRKYLSAAGLAALNIVKRPGTYQKVTTTGRALMTALQDAFAQVDIPVQVSGVEVCFDIYFLYTSSNHLT